MLKTSWLTEMDKRVYTVKISVTYLISNSFRKSNSIILKSNKFWTACVPVCAAVERYHQDMTSPIIPSLCISESSEQWWNSRPTMTHTLPNKRRQPMVALGTLKVAAAARTTWKGFVHSYSKVIACLQAKPLKVLRDRWRQICVKT